MVVDESLTERQRRGKKMLQLCAQALKAAGQIERHAKKLGWIFTSPKFLTHA
jgi:hypothetical protein